MLTGVSTRNNNDKGAAAAGSHALSLRQSNKAQKGTPKGSLPAQTVKNLRAEEAVTTGRR